MQQNQQSPAGIVLVMQIITATILAGPLVFLLYVLFATEAQPPNRIFTSYLGAGMAALMILLQFFVRIRPNRSAIPEDQRDQDFDPDSEDVFMAIAPTYQTELIIKIALLEGAAFLNIIAYMLERQTWTLAIAAVLLGLIAYQFPTHARIQNRIVEETRFWFDESV